MLVETHGQLAGVLGVTRPAIYRAEESGRIRRDPDGSWSVLDLVEDGRGNTNSLLRRGKQPPWLDHDQPLTMEHVMMLVARTRAQGGTVLEEGALEDGEGDREWRVVPPLAAVLRTGAVLPDVSYEELAWRVSDGQRWYAWSIRSAADLAAALEFEDVAAVRRALHALMRTTLAELRSRTTTIRERQA